MQQFIASNSTSEISADPCRPGQPFSLQRFIVFTFLFVMMLGGGGSLIAAVEFSNFSGGIQLISIIVDTAAVGLYTFSSNKNGMPPYMFRCPVVRGQLPRLLRRHLFFLLGLVIVQSAALTIERYLPAYWTTASEGSMTPFFVVLVFVCVSLVLSQILSNRSILASAHTS